ncbi:MAG: GIY-YIG nuclease family protein [Candidatus Doudnabacteria bacterium]|nr:GIY-YIG nuclease family protein [Candidatus Doudnabacteria bacterium]
MHYVYFLKSLKDNELYIGSCNDLKARFAKHNLGRVPSTKNRRPFKLVYYEAYASEEEARHREHNLKLRARALRQLLLRIRKSINS